MRVIGIDCGVTGALASLDEAGELRYFADLPIARHGAAKWVDGGKLLSMLFRAGGAEKESIAFVEQTWAMPDMGVTAANSKGLTLGSVLAIVQVAPLRHELVAPVRWKRAMNLLRPEEDDAEKKRASLERARELFPLAKLSRAKDHNRAEAMLLAHWGWQQIERQRSMFASAT